MLFPQYVLDSVVRHKNLDEVDFSSSISSTGGSGGYGHIIDGARKTVVEVTDPINYSFFIINQ